MNNDISQDKSLLDRLNNAIEMHFENEHFGVSELAREVGISRSQLHRKLQSLTGKSASLMIREYRLNKAKKMLENNLANVSEIAYKVGFGSSSYFNTCFHNYFGYPPGEAKFRKPKEAGRRLLISSKTAWVLSSMIILFVIIYFSLRQTKNFSKILNKPTSIEKSIAVLPFDNEGRDETNTYFVNGMMEDIRNHLSKIGDLRVISKTSTDKYKQTNLSTGEIAKELKVNYLLEGSVQKQGDQVKIHAQLIEAQLDDHIWAETYIRELDDVFKIQSDIAKAIAEELKAGITPKAKKILETIPTENSEAYIFYLRAKHFHSNYWISGNKSHIGMAIHFYGRAIEIDPKFALAYVWRGWAIFEQSWAEDFYSENYGDTLKYFAEKALSINPDLPEAILNLGNYYFQIGEYDKSIPLMEKSVELDPNLADAYFLLGMTYRNKGQYISAIINFEMVKKLTIQDLDYYPIILGYLGSLYYHIWDSERAEIEYTELLNYNPIQAYLGFIVLHETKGEWDMVKVYVDKICNIDSGENCLDKLSWYFGNTNDFPKALYYFEKSTEKKIARGALMFDTRGGGILYDKVNRKEEAKACFDKQIEMLLETIHLKKSFALQGFAHCELASVYAYLGDKDKAYEYLLEMEIGTFEGWAVEFIQIFYPFESLWEDEEFKEIIQRQEKNAADIRAEIDRLDKEGLL